MKPWSILRESLNKQLESKIISEIEEMKNQLLSKSEIVENLKKLHPSVSEQKLAVITVNFLKEEAGKEQDEEDADYDFEIVDPEDAEGLDYDDEEYEYYFIPSKNDEIDGLDDGNPYVADYEFEFYGDVRDEGKVSESDESDDGEKEIEEAQAKIVFKRQAGQIIKIKKCPKGQSLRGRRCVPQTGTQKMANRMKGLKLKRVIRAKGSGTLKRQAIKAKRTKKLVKSRSRNFSGMESYTSYEILKGYANKGQRYLASFSPNVERMYYIESVWNKSDHKNERIIPPVDASADFIKHSHIWIHKLNQGGAILSLEKYENIKNDIKAIYETYSKEYAAARENDLNNTKKLLKSFKRETDLALIEEKQSLRTRIAILEEKIEYLSDPLHTLIENILLFLGKKPSFSILKTVAHITEKYKEKGLILLDEEMKSEINKVLRSDNFTPETITVLEHLGIIGLDYGSYISMFPSSTRLLEVCHAEINPDITDLNDVMEMVDNRLCEIEKCGVFKNNTNVIVSPKFFAEGFWADKDTIFEALEWMKINPVSSPEAFEYVFEGCIENVEKLSKNHISLIKKLVSKSRLEEMVFDWQRKMTMEEKYKYFKSDSISRLNIARLLKD